MTTYFVANAGNNSNNGTTSGTPYQTLAKAVSVAISGDTILLNRGDRFLEQLTVPAANMTIDAYGAAATFDSDGYGTNAPIVDGGQTVSSWSTYTSGATAIYVNDTFTGSASTNLTAHTPNTGTSWTAQFGGSIILDGTGGVYDTTTPTTVYYCQPNHQVNGDYAVQAGVTFKTVIGGDIGGVVARSNGSTAGSQTYYSGYLDSAGNVAIQRLVNGSGGTVVGPTNVQAIVAGTTYTLKLLVQGLVITLFLNGSQVAQYTEVAPIQGPTALWQPGFAGILLRPGAAAETATTGVHISAFSSAPLDSGSPTNTFQAALGTQPFIVDVNGTYSFNGVGMNSLLNNQYFWQANVLYLRSDSGTPTNVTAAARNNGVVATSIANVTIQNIAVEHAQYEAYLLTNTANLNLNQCYGQRTSWTGNSHNGAVGHVGTQTNSVSQNCVFRQIGGVVFNGHTCTGPMSYLSNRCYDLYEIFGEGIQWDNTADTTTKIFRGNVIAVPLTQLANQTLWELSEKGGGAFFGDNWTVERNIIIGSGLFGTTHPGNSHIVRDNFYYKCGGGPGYTGYSMNGGGGALRVNDNSATAYSGTSFYRNVILDCVCGIWIDSVGTATRTTFSFYNNLILNLNVAPAVQNQTGTSAGTYQAYFNQSMSGTFENNLIFNSQGTGTGGLFFKNETSLNAWTTDYNLWRPDATGEFNFKGTGYNTLAAYQSGATRDSHSISSLPTFSNSGYAVPARPTFSDYWVAMLALRNAYRTNAKGVGVVVANVTQGSAAPSIGIEGTYGYWGTPA